MKPDEAFAHPLRYSLEEIFQLSEAAGSDRVAGSSQFSRRRTQMPGWGTVIRDEFGEQDGPCCVFLRLASGPTRVAQLVVPGKRRLKSCASGGWMLTSTEPGLAAYWIPQPPALRTFDEHGRILLEESAPIIGFSASENELGAAVRIPEGMHLDLVFWRIRDNTTGMCSELNNPLNLERQRTYLWSSKTAYQSPADLYLYLVNGHIYQNARAVPRKWKFCCELDAFELYVWLSGLALATKKSLYDLLRRQIVLSVIARQSADGGWYHGEWTDYKECHYRFHCGALLLLESALDEWPDDVLRESLEKGVLFVASRTDVTDLGLWFLHDSLEQSAEAMDEMLKQTGALIKGFGAWKPSRVLGKLPTNKMILNTHVDTTVAVHRYAEATGDDQFQAHITSARRATRQLLTLRPAELLYRSIYWAVGLTLLPASEGQALPLPLRALKRVTWKYLVPQLYRLKRLFPRLVMPGGLIERHLSPLHFDTKYHAVNVLDLARLWRRFPEDELSDVLRGAIEFVMRDDRSILKSWAEAKPRQFGIVVFAEALYHLCMYKQDPSYRRYLADTILLIEDLKLGLPPSLLGGNVEVTKRAEQTPCPSPTAAQLRVANLSTIRHKELIVVNPTDQDVELSWESCGAPPFAWTTGGAVPVTPRQERTWVPARGWLWGKETSGDLST